MNYKEKNDFERRRRGGGLNEELDHCGDTSCDSLDLDLELDSVSQLSVNSSISNSVTNGDIFKCVSSDNIPHIINTAGRYNQGCKK